MNDASDVAAVRLQFAHGLRDAGARSPRLIEAFARVPRERFLGEGPWKIGVIGGAGAVSYADTATADPVEVYRDTVIAIDPARGLNNGEPSSLAMWIDALDVRPGDAVAHIGAGTGYYTAIIAELAGKSGRVVGVEIDPMLAQRARVNLADRANVEIVERFDGDACRDRFDAMFVNCGVTHPSRAWIDALRDGGRLLFPVTAARRDDGIGTGAMYLATRRAASIAARFVSSVGIYPCAGQRSDELNAKLLRIGADDWHDVRSLRPDRHREAASCWLHTDGGCLSTLDPQGDSA